MTIEDDDEFAGMLAPFGVITSVAFAVSSQLAILSQPFWSMVSRRDARDNGSLLTYKPISVAPSI